MIGSHVKGKLNEIICARCWDVAGFTSMQKFLEIRGSYGGDGKGTECGLGFG